MDELLVLATLGLQWSERLQKINQLILDHRAGKKIDFKVLMSEDDGMRADFQKFIDSMPN